MGIDALIAVATGSMMIVAIALIVLSPLIATIIFAIRGDIPHALMCGVAMLTLIYPGLGFIILILVLIVTAFTRNVEVLGCVAVGFLTALIIEIALVTALGVGIAIAG